MNDRFGKGKGVDRKKASSAPGSIIRRGPGGEEYVTNAAKEASWVKMRSVTEQGALDEFLTTAELAGTDFTAEKMNAVKIIRTDQHNPYLLSAAEERSMARKQQRNKARLTVPRRPKWDENTTPYQLDNMERESLLEWRRGLAEMQEIDDLLMTPFERNLEVWRQLWRVIERSDLVVQIVDARNPLMFRSEDLENYVKEVDSKKRNLLLVNKADMMTETQRSAWADYFQKQGINYKFFSAHLAKEANEAQDDLSDSEDDEPPAEDEIAQKAKKIDLQDQRDEDEEWDSEEELDSDVGQSHSSGQDERIRILTVDELEELFLDNTPTQRTTGGTERARKTTIGLVGYPNVGKSSTINALIGAKKVSVSSTPGKTKHFQTIHLSDQVILCDCPGLVFPNFAFTKAELVCNGVLPIDQMREHMGPVGLVTQRIPQPFLEAVYGIKIRTRALEEGGTGVPTASELLYAYAKARGFATTGQGNPDESRASRYILKDYVNGKLLYCHPPPSDPEIDGQEFNKDLYDFAHLPARRQAFILSHTDEASLINDTSSTPGGIDDNQSLMSLPALGVPQGQKTKRLDKNFFGPGSGTAGHLKMPFNYQYTESGQKQLSGRKAKAMVALERGVDPSELKMGGKKHFKGNKKRTKGKKVEDDD
ncbi:putative ribosome biogenesis gtpase lsg1 [Phaeomoniella chlamydospora]|uniref:Putative ribosome biogenesis gtpase lsg1 n=1 Tax=Phaeomoniella chlamydospora TaxID=158046 RepID=A0A0G2HAL6_PHACM|nr:putative ribosome biogenesis gtpase lsg1 [Phaeomoniella chlamydospora]